MPGRPPIKASLWRTAALGLTAVSVAASATAFGSSFVWFTSQAAFNARLEANYAGALDGLGANPLSDPLSFSGITTGSGSFSFEASSSPGLYSVWDGPRGLTPSDFQNPLVFQQFSPGVRAFGGLFSLTDLDELRQSGSFSLAIYTASGTARTLLTSTSATVTSSGPSFLGLIDFNPALSFSRIELGTPAATLFPTAEQVTVGVPEPSAITGLAAGIALIAIAWRVRSRLRKAAIALVAAAAFAIPTHAALESIPLDPTPPAAGGDRPS
ncbi:MAG: hypothetical protein EBR28_02645 [Planctomycetia bacterium]|nr:hypothetical protein [Planctomycetia bacterium]